MSSPNDTPNAPANGAATPPGDLPYPPGILPGVAPPPALPVADPSRVICLRGPCRHFWRIETNVDYGNPAGTFAELGLEEPREITARCMIQNGVDFTMDETDVYECNKWDPLVDGELVQLSRRRKRYFKEHPEHDPSCQDVDIDRPSWWRRLLGKSHG